MSYKKKGIDRMLFLQHFKSWILYILHFKVTSGINESKQTCRVWYTEVRTRMQKKEEHRRWRDKILLRKADLNERKE